MRRAAILSTCVCLAGLAAGQIAPAERVEVAAGTVIKATLDSELSTKTSQAGEEFTATVMEPVRATDGSIAIAPGAKLHGEITRIEHGGDVTLNFRFISLSLHDGASVPLSSSVISVEAHKSAASGPVPGGSYALTAKGEEAVVPAETRVVVHLDAGIAVPPQPLPPR